MRLVLSAADAPAAGEPAADTAAAGGTRRRGSLLVGLSGRLR